MPDEPMPKGVLQAVSHRVRELDQQARTDLDGFWERERRLPYDETALAYLIRSVGSFILILTTYAVLAEDEQHQQRRDGNG